MAKHEDYYSDFDKFNILVASMEDEEAKRIVLNCDPFWENPPKRGL